MGYLSSVWKLEEWFILSRSGIISKGEKLVGYHVVARKPIPN